MENVVVGIVDPFHPAILEEIRQAAPRDWRLSIATGPSLEEHTLALSLANIVFVTSTTLPAALLRTAGRLRFIQKLGAGVDLIDLEHCASRGIGVARLQAGNSIPVAEHTVMMMLAASRRLAFFDRDTRAGGWMKEAARGVIRQLTGKTIGLVGFGAIGREVARVLRGFTVRILYYDPRRADPQVESTYCAVYSELEEVLRQSDIVSLHLPLMPETRGLINAARIAVMKRGAIVINCARGGLVDEAALSLALRTGHIFAAGIDAFEHEPPVASALLASDNTIITPHIAAATVDNFRSIANRAVKNTQRFLAGEELPAADVVIAPSRS